MQSRFLDVPGGGWRDGSPTAWEHNDKTETEHHTAREHSSYIHKPERPKSGQEHIKSVAARLKAKSRSKRTKSSQSAPRVSAGQKRPKNEEFDFSPSCQAAATYCHVILSSEITIADVASTLDYGFLHKNKVDKTPTKISVCEHAFSVNPA